MKLTHKSILLFLMCLSTLALNAANPQEEDYAKKLRKIQKDVPLTFNQHVKAEIEILLKNKDDSTSKILGLGNIYFPIIEKLLKPANIPTELKYLAPAISALNNVAVSDYGASGLWQLMYSTAKMKDLKINSYIDERRNTEKATTAAAEYLKDLKIIYEDWHLSIAAFIATPLNVNHAIRKAGGSISYWQVHPHLQEASRRIVPKFIAYAYIFNYYKDHGLKPEKPNLIEPSDTVTVKEWVSFQQIAQVLDITLDELRAFNPIFKKDIIPFAEPNYTIQLPIKLVDSFRKYEDSIYHVEVKEDVSDFIRNDVIKESQGSTTTTPAKTTTTTTTGGGAGTVKVYYTVKSGDVLGNIADWFDTYVSNVKRWNGLRSDRIYAGQKLVMYVPAAKASYYRSINTMSQAQKKQIAAKD